MSESRSAGSGIDGAASQEFKCDYAVQLAVTRAVDYAHPSLADLFQQVVVRYRSCLALVTR